ncbi:Uncharacterised protein [Kingella potus]|uniref:Uncharacterized protein n=1 Tax=Kingella potus TaxID=265175 RepID=A0A377R3W1_9NEIS|nr:hypothetical protein [Kingella potus]UOO99908.1 hypothetical protein LVJ84_07495 [Kingella potus]STR03166.1 Uncharacterised protein [Kingella potus]
MPPAGMTERHMEEAEAVTRRICAALDSLKTTLAFGQSGITILNADYAE